MGVWDLVKRKKQDDSSRYSERYIPIGDIEVLLNNSRLPERAKEALQAQMILSQGMIRLKSAASRLCDIWNGDKADAFMCEQEVLDDQFVQLISVGSDYILRVKAALEKFRETEESLAKTNDKANGTQSGKK